MSNILSDQSRKTVAENMLDVLRICRKRTKKLFHSSIGSSPAVRNGQGGEAEGAGSDDGGEDVPGGAHRGPREDGPRSGKPPRLTSPPVIWAPHCLCLHRQITN